MTAETHITIMWGEPDKDGYRESWHYYGNIVPVVGSHFSAWSQRGSDGNYMNEGILGNKGRPIISGRVTDVRYHWEGRGPRQNWSETMFVYVLIDADEEYRGGGRF